VRPVQILKVQSESVNRKGLGPRVDDISKCDEQRPKCGRCRTADAPCEYRPDKPIDFKSMNSKIASRYKVTEPRKEKKDSVRRGKAGLSDNDGQAALTSNIKVQQASKGPPLLHSLSTHWEDPALCLFFQDYVLQTDDAGFGFLDNFPKLYGTSSDEAFKNAVSAISLASFSNQVRCVDLGVAAKKSYGKALLSVKKALQDPSRSTSHATLASILTLNMYDVSFLTLRNRRFLMGSRWFVKTYHPKFFGDPMRMHLV
jgi:hypothetical protein